MQTGLLVLGSLQVIVLLVYRWVGQVCLSQPLFRHPAIFHSSTARRVLLFGPPVSWLALIVLAFFFTEWPWAFLILSIAGFAAFSVRLHPDL